LEIDGVAIAKGDRSILHDACATISVGGHVAIVGPSGAGKSTIATLLVRLTDPSAGNIRIAGRKLHEFDLGALREAIVIVPQDPLVFDATLYDNLTCLNPDATGDAVEAAVKICRLSEVVDGLPAGYDTVLGQRGFRLSGGERQRICLARTLIARPQIVILDEALTGIDVEMEASILADIRSVRRGCTTLVITHRLHYAADLDGVVVVEGGRIVSSGTHAQACSSSAWYRSAYEQTRRPEQLVAV
jgi:ATP-binding cassette subfamily B protein